MKLKESDGAVSFEVRVVLRASKSALRGVSDGALKISLAAPPVEGEANAELIAFVSELLDVPRRSVELVQGERSKRKVLRVRGLTAVELRARIGVAEGEGAG